MNDWKDSCKVATTGGDIDLDGGAPSVLDGSDLAVGDRILVKDQAAPPGIFSPENGIYTVIEAGTGSNGLWTRSIDANTSAQVQCGLTVYIGQGPVNAKLVYQLTSPGDLILGMTGLRFEVMFSGLYPVLSGTNANYRFKNSNTFQLIDTLGSFRTVYFDENGVLQSGPAEA
jgi:hypothetical protein